MYGGKGRNCPALTALLFVVWLHYMLCVLYSSFSLALTPYFASRLLISFRLSLNWQHFRLISLIQTLQYQSIVCAEIRSFFASASIRLEMKLLGLRCGISRARRLSPWPAASWVEHGAPESSRGSSDLARRWVGGEWIPSQSGSSLESIHSATRPGHSSFSAQSRQSYLRSNIVLNTRFMKGWPHSADFTTSQTFVLHAYMSFSLPTQVKCEAVIRYCHRASFPSRSW